MGFFDRFKQSNNENDNRQKKINYAQEFINEYDKITETKSLLNMQETIIKWGELPESKNDSNYTNALVIMYKLQNMDKKDDTEIIARLFTLANKADKEEPYDSNLHEWYKTTTFAHLYEYIEDYDETKEKSNNSEDKTNEDTLEFKLPKSATTCNWKNTSEWIPAVKKTWNVYVTPYTLSPEDSKNLEGRYPMKDDIKIRHNPVTIEESSNSIFWHQRESWIDYGYVKFLYNNRLYYINTSPTLMLTQELYDLRGNLNNMAKILMSLSSDIGTNRENMLLVLDGELKDNS